MGQYYLIVNPAKRQFLNPHKFGCGLKLMEFSHTQFGPQQALVILLAHANGRGGGDLDVRPSTPKEDADLVGSWAGDPIHVAGDYDDPGFGVPEGWDKSKTLFRATEEGFEDISDRMISLVARAEGHLGHPWACVDLANDGWRQVPEWGELPERTPELPAAGSLGYEKYAARAVKPMDVVLASVETFARKHPDLVGDLTKALAAKLKSVRDAANPRLKAAANG